MTSNQSLYLYFCAGLVAFTCVAYELLLGSYATFLMGASIFQYSLVISLMMLNMGIGALVTKRLKDNCFQAFLLVEILLSWCAMLAVPLMYLSFALNFAPSKVLIFFVSLLGLGIGMEIPLLSHMNPSSKSLSQILFSDYLGGFLGGLAFPILLFPWLGFFQIGALLALINALIALSFLILFRHSFKRTRTLWCVLIGTTLVFCLTEVLFAETIRIAMESYLFGIDNRL